MSDNFETFALLSRLKRVGFVVADDPLGGRVPLDFASHAHCDVGEVAGRQRPMMLKDIGIQLMTAVADTLEEIHEMPLVRLLRRAAGAIERTAPTGNGLVFIEYAAGPMIFSRLMNSEPASPRIMMPLSAGK